MIDKSLETSEKVHNLELELATNEEKLNNLIQKIEKFEKKLEENEKSLEEKLLKFTEFNILTSSKIESDYSNFSKSLQDKTKEIIEKYEGFTKLSDEHIENINSTYTKLTQLLENKTKDTEAFNTKFEQYCEEANSTYKQFADTVNNKKQEIENLYQDVEKKIIEYNNTLFNGEQSYQFRMNKFENEAKATTQELIASINQLLPSALSAGLATAYKNQKDSYNKKIKYTNISIWIGYVLLFLFGLYNIYNFSNLENLQFDKFIFKVVVQMPFIFSIIWFLIFSITRLNKFDRLQQEYSHKEALASSYSNFKQQIDDIGSDTDIKNTQNMLTKLMESTLEAISYNPSITLDKETDVKMPVNEITSTIINALKDKK